VGGASCLAIGGLNAQELHLNNNDSNNFPFNKTNRHTNFPNLFLSRNSTSFRHLLCPKHVEFLDKNKFGKLVCLLVLLK
jgi:hypothetical protein